MSRRTNRRLFLLVLILGLAGFTAVWYGASRQVGSGTPEFGGEYVEGMIGAPQRVNPLFAGLNAADQSLVSLVFAGLTRLDGQGRAYPDLAETWTASEDARSFTFTLRPNLVWQDGAPLTSEDVVFTFRLLLDSGLRVSPPPPEALAAASISLIDSRSIRFDLTEPFAPLPAYLTAGILPRHLLGNTEPQMVDVSPFNLRPIGAGPYRIIDLTPERALLEANTAFHAGTPYITRLELRFFANGQDVIAALGRGELDGALFTTGLSEAERLQLDETGMDAQWLPSGALAFIYLNLDQPQFSDRRVRQALLLALDRGALAEAVYGGMARAAESPLTMGAWAEAAPLRRYSTDRRAAELLLDEAGWARAGGGIRQRTGTPLAFAITVTPDPVHIAVANTVAASWNALGASVSVEVKGGTELVRDILSPRRFSALLLEQPAAPDPDPYLHWHSSQAGPGGANLAAFDMPRADSLLEEARRASQQIQREELYSQFQELFAQELPSLPLYTSYVLYAQDPEVRDRRPSMLSGPGDRFWQVYQWHLKTK